MSKTICYEIYQCPPTIPYFLLPYDETEFSFADYVHVYQGLISFADNNQVLENIFTTLNIDHPKNYFARSLSVSDIIVLDDGGEKRAYYVQPMGFKQIEYPKSLSFTRRPRNAVSSN